MQTWPSPSYICYQKGLRFKAGTSHLHGSKVLLHLLRDSSHEGKLRQQQDFAF